MKNRITAVILTFALCIAPVVPTLAGFSDKLPETATVGEAFTIATDSIRGYAIQDGILWTWGRETAGEDEEGYLIFNTRPAPEPIMEDAASVRTNGDVAFVLKTDGALWSWGFGGNASLGDDETGFRMEPAQIMDGVNAICAEMERDFAFAIKEDDSLWGWGRNESYQLGDGTRETRFTPVRIMDDVKSVRIMNDYPKEMVYAVKTDGSLWKWGTDYNEIIGNDNVIRREVVAEFKTPTLVTENADEIIAGFSNPNLDAEGNLRINEKTIIPDVAEVTDSGYGDYLWRKKDGTVWYDGYNGGNPNHSGTGEIVLKEDAAAVTGVAVSPANASLARGGTLQFSAVVTGTGNPAQTVTWSVTGGGGGTGISGSGLLTVGADETAATLTVTATSTVDSGQSGAAAVTVETPGPGSVVPAPEKVQITQSSQGALVYRYPTVMPGGGNRDHFI
jgi:hypothetical protein